MYGIIYKTENLVNGKIYIGQSVLNKKNFESYLGSGILLKKAIKKYGIENFERTTLCECSSKEQMNRLERLFIKMLTPDYNISKGGDGCILTGEDLIRRGISIAEGLNRMSQENKELRAHRTSLRVTGDKNPSKRKEVRDKISNTLLGRTLSEEHKNAISKGLKGRVQSENMKQKCKESNKETYIKKGIFIVSIELETGKEQVFYSRREAQRELNLKCIPSIEVNENKEIRKRKYNFRLATEQEKQDYIINYYNNKEK